jgi:hypothetical protein
LCDYISEAGTQKQEKERLRSQAKRAQKKVKV